jgi:hypothetical protein
VFGARYAATLNQTVTITGAGTPNSFNQTAPSTSLIINGAVGNNALPLQFYADPIVSSAGGTITITATGFSSSGYGVDGIAFSLSSPSRPRSCCSASALLPCLSGGGLSQIARSQRDNSFWRSPVGALRAELEDEAVRPSFEAIQQPHPGMLVVLAGKVD